MTLPEFAAKTRLQLFDDLRQGSVPSLGTFDPSQLEQARHKGQPQMGATVFLPDQIRFEFIYPDKNSSTMIFTVTVNPPERIVFMPVPKWVVESVWQGEVLGSYHFESHAMLLADAFQRELTPENNPKWFEKQLPTHRE